MSQAETKPRTIRHFQRSSLPEFTFGADCEHRRIRRTAGAVTYLILLTAFAVPAIAHEPSICPSNISASGPAPQARSAGAAALLEHKLPEATKSAFDPATLPSLDSIDAQTDIKVFLQSSVPEELRVAALGRAWTVDPAIRDFKGLQEMDMNFNGPDSIPGFGEIGPEVDVERMVAQIFGETPQVVARTLEQATLFSRVMLRLFDLRSTAATAP